MCVTLVEQRWRWGRSRHQLSGLGLEVKAVGSQVRSILSRSLIREGKGEGVIT